MSVTDEEIREMCREYGFDDPSQEQMTAARLHGLTASDIRHRLELVRQSREHEIVPTIVEMDAAYESWRTKMVSRDEWTEILKELHLEGAERVAHLKVAQELPGVELSRLKQAVVDALREAGISATVRAESSTKSVGSDDDWQTNIYIFTMPENPS